MLSILLEDIYLIIQHCSQLKKGRNWIISMCIVIEVMILNYVFDAVDVYVTHRIKPKW